MKTETFPRFRRDNTRGFSSDELAQLNSRYEHAVEQEDDEDRRDAVAERILASFGKEV